MLKLSLGLFLIITLFNPTIQINKIDDYCAKYVATFPLRMEACISNSNSNYKMIEDSQNNNCSYPRLFTLTYSPDFCKNRMIISPIIPVVLSKKENWNEYIVLSGSNFASEQKKNIVQSVKIPEKNNFSQLALSEFLFAISAFLFTVSFLISLVQ